MRQWRIFSFCIVSISFSGSHLVFPLSLILCVSFSPPDLKYSIYKNSSQRIKLSASRAHNGDPTIMWKFCYSSFAFYISLWSDQLALFGNLLRKKRKLKAAAALLHHYNLSRTKGERVNLNIFILFLNFNSPIIKLFFSIMFRGDPIVSKTKHSSRPRTIINSLYCDLKKFHQIAKLPYKQTEPWIFIIIYV